MFEKSFSPLYSQDNGRPAKPISLLPTARTMARQHTDIIQIHFIGIALAVSFSHGLFPILDNDSGVNTPKKMSISKNYFGKSEK